MNYDMFILLFFTALFSILSVAIALLFMSKLKYFFMSSFLIGFYFVNIRINYGVETSLWFVFVSISSFFLYFLFLGAILLWWVRKKA